MNNITFNPWAFVTNLKYMGLGMLGVFIIVGIIILTTHFTSFTIKKIEEQKELENNNK